MCGMLEGVLGLRSVRQQDVISGCELSRFSLTGCRYSAHQPEDDHAATTLQRGNLLWIFLIL